VALLGALVLIVALQNSQEVSFEFLFASFKAPLIFIILLAAMIGGTIGFIAPLLVRARQDRMQHDS